MTAYNSMTQSQKFIYEFIKQQNKKLCECGCTDRYLRESEFAFLIICFLLQLRAGIKIEKRAEEMYISARGNISLYFVFLTIFENRHVLAYMWNTDSKDIIEVRGWYLQLVANIQNLIRSGIYE